MLEILAYPSPTTSALHPGVPGLQVARPRLSRVERGLGCPLRVSWSGFPPPPKKKKKTGECPRFKLFESRTV